MEDKTANRPQKKKLSFDSTDITQGLKDVLRYKPLTRQDYDMSVVDNWMEVRCIDAPKRRSNHSSFIYNNHLYVVGGLDICEGRMSDVMAVEIQLSDSIPKWRPIETTGSIPEPLSFQSGDIGDNKFYMFGGQNNKEAQSNNLNVLNLDDSKWEKRMYLETDVMPLSGHSCTYYKEKNILVIFGGYYKGLFRNDLYTYNIDTNEWSKINADIKPTGRIKHSSTLVGSSLFIYAGENFESSLDDMWRFDLNDYKWNKVVYNNKSLDDIPTARSGHSAVLNPNDKCIYIFGGRLSNIQERNEFWKYNTTNNTFSIIHDTLLDIDTENPSDRHEPIHTKKSNLLI
jgi:N-acetylneuraminic acid mutarotase